MKRTFTSGFLLLLLLLSSLSPVLAQSLDPSFQAATLKMPYVGSNITSPVQVVRLANNKLLVAGGFDFSNGVLASKIRRLNSDGTNDASFNPGGIGPNGFVSAMLALSDGKVIIVGGFTSYNDVPAMMIARLTANGTLDPTFSSAGIGPARQLTSLAMQTDGKILVGSRASDLAGQLSTGGVVRLNADGSRDASFNVGVGAKGLNDSQTFGDVLVRTLLVQTDGKILVGGRFTTFSDQPANNLVRLNADGSLDAGFVTGTGFTNTTAPSSETVNVRALVQQPDGKILVGGAFQAYDANPNAGLVRLLPDGTLDNTLSVGTGFTFATSVNVATIYSK